MRDIDAELKSHTHDGNNSGQVSALDLSDFRRFILYRIVAATTDTATGTTVGGDLVMPFSGRIIEVGATVDTAGTTNTTDIDINVNGSTIMSTVITIDSGEKTSRTAAAAPALTTASIEVDKGDILTFDIDAISTTAAKGLTIFLVVLVTTY